MSRGQVFALQGTGVKFLDFLMAARSVLLPNCFIPLSHTHAWNTTTLSKGHSFEDNEKLAPALGHIPEAHWPDQKHLLYKFKMHLDTEVLSQK